MLSDQLNNEDNVVNISKGTTVYEIIKLVLSDLKENSSNTAKNYKSNYIVASLYIIYKIIKMYG